MAVTIKDVAKTVGVAPSTVSRVIQNNPSISDETKEKVRAAMKKLGYVPNIAAQNLVRGLTNAIGVILPPDESKERHAEPFFMQVLTAINHEATSIKQTVAIATGNTIDELFENVKLMHLQKRVDGFLLLYTREDDEVREYLIENKVPYVLIGTPTQYENETSYVDNDNQTMGKDATDYLIQRGHKKIIFVTDALNDEVVHNRFFGYQKSLRQANIPSYPMVELNRKDPFSVMDFRGFLRKERATGLVVIGDIVALRVVQLLQMSNFRIPEDVSVISFNDSIFSKLIHPYFTSFDIHINELGKMALRRLISQIQGTEEIQSAKVIIPHALKERESVLDLTK